MKELLKKWQKEVDDFKSGKFHVQYAFTEYPDGYIEALEMCIEDLKKEIKSPPGPPIVRT